MKPSYSPLVSNSHLGLLKGGRPQRQFPEIMRSPKLIPLPRPTFFLWLFGTMQVVAEPAMLRPAVAIVANGVGIDMGSYAIPCVADWNGDGTPDLILGNLDGTIFRYAGYPFRVTRIEQVKPGEETLEWASSPLLKYTVLAGSSPDQITTPLVTGLASGGDVTTCTCPMSAPSQYYRIQMGP